jgi:PAS domain S-box-containing protein
MLPDEAAEAAEAADPRRVVPEPFRRSSDVLYRNLLEQLPAIVYVDLNEPDAGTLYVSPQVEGILGYRAEDYIADRGLWSRTLHPDDQEAQTAAWRRAIERQEPFGAEYRFVKPDGAVVWVYDSCSIVYDDDGRPLFWQGLILDITPYKAAEEDLRSSEARYRLLVENVPAIVYQVAPDDDRRTLWVSAEVERQLGYSQREWLEQPDIWMELLHPDDRETTLAAYDEHNETGRPWSREYRLIASDGRAVWFRDVATLTRDESGEHWLGVQLDITELKHVERSLRDARDELEERVRERTAELEEANELMSLEIAERRHAEAELRETELKYRTLAEQIPAVTYVYTVDRDGQALEWYTSPRIEQVLGFTVDEWHEGDFWITRLHPDDRQAMLAGLLRSETTGESFEMEYRVLHKDGHIVHVLDHAVMLSRDERGRPHRFQGVVLDVTSARVAEARANEQEQRYQALAEQIPAITYVAELHAELGTDSLTYISPQITSVLGYAAEDWADTSSWLACLHPDDRHWIGERWREVVKTGEPYVVEYRIRHRDGSYVWVRDQGATIDRDALGRPRQIQGIMIDTTDTRRTERLRRDAEDAYRRLVEQIPAITYIEIPSDDPAESILSYMSPQVEEILGVSAEALMRDPDHFRRMLHNDDRDWVIEANARADATGEPFDETFRVVRDDGSVVWFHSSARLVRDEDGRALFWHGVALDVTTEYEVRASLRELEERYSALASAVDAAEPDER